MVTAQSKFQITGSIYKIEPAKTLEIFFLNSRIFILGKKWIKILFALWFQGTTYDETLHIQNLKAKNVPWAMAL